MKLSKNKIMAGIIVVLCVIIAGLIIYGCWKKG